MLKSLQVFSTLAMRRRSIRRSNWTIIEDLLTLEARLTDVPYFYLLEVVERVAPE